MLRRLDRDALVLPLVLLAFAAYVPSFLDRGWIPHDEGVIAHSAERVRHGELPHRDFDEIYTGGLSYVHALAFELFGVRLTALRRMLLVFAFAFVPALYCVARRTGPPWLAGALTAVGVVWSLPNYFAGLPSWYNLFFATFGTLALLRHLDDGRRRWLVLAGLCAACSILVKIAGLYFAAAALLALAHREHVEARRDRADGAPAAGRAGTLLAIEAGAAAVFVAGLLRTFAPTLDPMPLVHFVLPGALLAGLLVWSEWRHGRGPSGPRLRRLGTLVGPFALGAAVPLALFAVPYAAAGALDELWRGLFVLPARRVEAAAMALPPAGTLVAAVPYAILLFAPAVASRAIGAGLALLVAAALATVVATAGTSAAVYQAVWHAARPLVPLAALATAIRLGRAPVGADGHRHATVYLLVAVASLTSLVQFPYAFGIYFCYAAPLVVVAVAAVVGVSPGPRPPHLAVLAFAFAFAVAWLNPGFLLAIGLRYIPYPATAPLTLERAGLRVLPIRKAEYERVVALVERHAGRGPIYAGPDAPEVYFLSGRRNPTRVLFDIFDEPADRTARILATIDQEDVKVVVLNTRPEFSPIVPTDLMRGLLARFPHWQPVERFDVGWRP